jgi:hypothetical protein
MQDELAEGSGKLGGFGDFYVTSWLPNPQLLWHFLHTH